MDNDNDLNPPARSGPMTPCLAVGSRDAAKMLGIGQRLLWSLTNRGAIPHVRLGKRIVYPVRELTDFLSQQTTGGNKT